VKGVACWKRCKKKKILRSSALANAGSEIVHN
jgi:hypothetical protein